MYKNSLVVLPKIPAIEIAYVTKQLLFLFSVDYK